MSLAARLFAQLAAVDRNAEEANFSACLRHALAMEGGFSNDPSDHGGSTNWGSTVATLTHWRGHAVTEVDLLVLGGEAKAKRAVYSDSPSNRNPLVHISICSRPWKGKARKNSALA